MSQQEQFEQAKLEALKIVEKEREYYREYTKRSLFSNISIQHGKYPIHIYSS